MNRWQTYVKGDPKRMLVQCCEDPYTLMAIDQCGIIGLVMEARNNPLYRGPLPRG